MSGASGSAVRRLPSGEPGMSEDHRYTRMTTRAALRRLSPRERRAVGQAIRAALVGPFFGRNFRPLIGVSREEVKCLLDRWPSVDESTPDADLVVNNCLLNLLQYPPGCDSALHRLITVSPDELEAIYMKWRRLRYGFSLRRNHGP